MRLSCNNCIPKNVTENVENKECLAFFLCLGTHLMRIYMCKCGWISILLSKINYIYIYIIQGMLPYIIGFQFC